VGSIWLPIGSTNFSHFFRDPESQQEPIANDVTELPDRTADRALLDTSVLRRLCDTLHRSGYKLCVPLSSADDREHAGSVVFYAAHPRDRGGDLQLELRDTLLVVSEDGFLTWIVPSGPDMVHHRGRLQEHVIGLFGDISHDTDRDPGSRNIDLKDYAMKGGILNYFQLNIVLEGLWNRNFQLQYFFSDRRSEKLNSKVRSDYSIPSFIEPLLVPMVSDVVLDELAGNAARALHRGRADVAGSVAACRALSDHLRSPGGQAERCTVLLRFLRVTKDRSLLQTKLRIEICRRALVQELLGVAHRVQPVEQIISPDAESETVSKVSESQLRGYLMLIAAKLPITQNLSLYLSEAVQQFAEPSGRGGASHPLDATTLERELLAWNTLLESVADNVQSLERAVAQSSRDRLLYEQEQVRAENETLAEMERLRDSDPGGSAPALEDSSFSALEVAIALAVSLTAAMKYFHGLSLLWAVPSFGLIIGLIFIALHKGATKLLHIMRMRQWTRRAVPARVFYEMDLRVDGYIGDEVAEDLLADEGFELRWDAPPDDPRRERVGESFKSPDNLKRSSFRIERVTADESITKVHMDLFLRLQRAYRWRRQYELLRADKETMHLSLTYELVFHRSGQHPGYILREFRARATHNRPLTRPELEAMRTLVIQGMVNGLLEEKDRISESTATADSVFALRPHRSGPFPPAAGGPAPTGQPTGEPGDNGGNGHNGHVRVETTS
jgi:hypothetical protein